MDRGTSMKIESPQTILLLVALFLLVGSIRITILPCNTTNYVPHDDCSSYSESGFVDYEPVYFSNPIPSDLTNYSTDLVWVEIDLSDNSSGIDINTIEVRTTEENGELSHWDRVYFWEGDPNSSIHIRVQLRLLPKMLNIVQFRANDNANLGYVCSCKFQLYYDPDLGVPKVQLIETGKLVEIENKIKLEWEGKYVDPTLLTYELFVNKPNETFNLIYEGTSSFHDFHFTIPGQYKWYVICYTQNMTDQSEVFSILYDPPLVEVEIPQDIKFETDDMDSIRVWVTNSLEYKVELSISIQSHFSFICETDHTIKIDPSGREFFDIIIKINGTLPGEFYINLYLTDQFAREKEIPITFSITDKTEEPIVGESDSPFSNIVFNIALTTSLLIIIIMSIIILLILKKKGKLNDVYKPIVINNRNRDDTLNNVSNTHIIREEMLDDEYLNNSPNSNVIIIEIDKN